MFTKNQAKLIKSLQNKKNRKETGLFTVEGEKSVVELLNSDFQIEFVVLTNDFFNQYKKILEDKKVPYEILKQEEIEKISNFESNNSSLALVRQKIGSKIKISPNEITLILDEIKDPGNLGTIIRIADWYGIKNIIASENTVDFYNPKVISASKGSFTRINISYTDLKEILSKTELPVFGTFMKGEDVHTKIFPKSGVLVMGSESNGISKEIESLIKEKITIPSYGCAESLNVAIATAVVLDNWKRKTA